MDTCQSILRILLADPRGFCAGVERAIAIVESALKKYGPPIYVRHEIVHNRHVIEDLKTKGAIFVDELEDVPCYSRVIFSAHGVAKSVINDAKNRQLQYIDATCPLVSKVHNEAERLYNDGMHIILIGHAGHPEIIGTMGQIPDSNAITLIETESDVNHLNFPPDTSLAYITQTTLSVDDTANIITKLINLYPSIRAPKKSDICYATVNRQKAVNLLAQEAELILVIGAENSSNSKRLTEVGYIAGCSNIYLITSVDDINWLWFNGTNNKSVNTLGITAGASAPEKLVNDVINVCRKRFNVTIEVRTVAEEDIIFRLPAI